ncbi:hypothetical protein WN943_013725 [Citrus x changshan-huyou]
MSCGFMPTPTLRTGIYISATFLCAFLNKVPAITFLLALPFGLEKVNMNSLAGRIRHSCLRWWSTGAAALYGLRGCLCKRELASDFHVNIVAVLSYPSSTLHSRFCLLFSSIRFCNPRHVVEFHSSEFPVYLLRRSHSFNMISSSAAKSNGQRFPNRSLSKVA